MVHIASFPSALATAFLLSSSIVLSEPVLTYQEVITTLNDCTTQVAALDTTAKRIDAEYSCFQYGFFNSGPFNKLVNNIPTLDQKLTDMIGFLDPDLTPPLDSTTEATEQNRVWTAYLDLTTAARQLFRDIETESDGVNCQYDPLDLGIPLLVDLLDFSEEGGKVRAAIVSLFDALGDLRYTIDDYMVLYYNDVFENWLRVSEAYRAAIKKYDDFKPEEPEEPEDPEK